MTTLLPKLDFFVKKRLLKSFHCCRDAGTRTRYLIILKLDAGRDPMVIADYLGIHRDTVYRVAQRFRQRGVLGLLDGRRHNGPHKLSRDYLTTLDRLVRDSPHNHGHRRPTWTRELLLLTLRPLGFPKVHVATLSRALAQIRARRA